MLFGDVTGGLEEFQGNEFESLAFKAGDDLTDKTTLDTYRDTD